MGASGVLAWVALGLYVAGLALAFGVRTWIHLRSTGSSGFHGVSGRPGSAAWWGGMLFVAAVALGVAGPVLAITGLIVPPAALTGPEVGVLGLVVALAGLAVVVVAQAGMGASWRIGVDESERTALVTAGLFRWIRNPIFTGMVAVAVGMVLLVPTLVTVLALACLVVGVQLQVRVIEEPYLERAHGEAYRRYVAQAGRFLPRATR